MSYINGDQNALHKYLQTLVSMDWGSNGKFDRSKTEFSYISFYGATTVNGKPTAILKILMK